MASMWAVCRLVALQRIIRPPGITFSDRVWYIYTMEYYSAIKRNETGSFVETWMDLETVIQSEVSQKEKNK